MDFEKYERIKFSRRGRILTVSLHRPDKLNACDELMHKELSRVFSDVRDDEASDVVILTGSGKAFCAGGDLQWMVENDDPSIPEAKKIVFGLLDLEKPVIARINGPAAGLGATLALFCDLAYAAQDARIADPHVRAGMPAGDGGAIIWPQLIGFMRAKEFLFTGDSLTGAEAAQMGLINAAVAADELDDVVNKMADRLAAGSQPAIRATKISINLALRQLANTILDASMAYEALAFRTPEVRRRIEAILQQKAGARKG